MKLILARSWKALGGHAGVLFPIYTALAILNTAISIITIGPVISPVARVGMYAMMLILIPASILTLMASMDYED